MIKLIRYVRKSPIHFLTDPCAIMVSNSVLISLSSRKVNQFYCGNLLKNLAEIRKNPGSADPVNHAPAHALSRRKSAFIFAKQVEVIHSFLVEQWDCYLAWSGSSERRLRESCMQRTRVKLVRGSWKSNEWLLIVSQHLLEDLSTSIVAL